MKTLKTTVIACAALLMMSASSCQKDKYPELGDGLYAEIITSKGTMVAKLAYDKVPVTVANFVGLAEGTHPMLSDELKGKPFYNGIIFHRVMNNFMIQGGDPDGTGRGSAGFKFESEFDESLLHNKPGMLSMANSGGYNTNGSQFFITEVPYPSLDYIDAQGNIKKCDQPRTSCHPVFGELVLGLDIQDSISNVPVSKDRATLNKPLEDVVIEQVNIVRQGFDARKFDAVSAWNTELPLLEEKRKQQQEEARKKAEEARKLQEEKSKEAALETVAQLNEYKTKASKTSTGLMTYVIKKGNGPKLKTGQTANVNYEGYFADGKLFDSNVKEVEERYGKYNQQKEQRGMYAPTPMQVSPDASLVAGFKEALANMSIGDKLYAFLPPHLGWGERGSPPVIPANADTIFIIEVVSAK